VDAARRDPEGGCERDLEGKKEKKEMVGETSMGPSPRQHQEALGDEGG
jgi:hypothetical protein